MKKSMLGREQMDELLAWLLQSQEVLCKVILSPSSFSRDGDGDTIGALDRSERVTFIAKHQLRGVVLRGVRPRGRRR